MLSDDLRALADWVRAAGRGEASRVLADSLQDCLDQALALEGWWPRPETLPPGVIDLAEARHAREMARTARQGRPDPPGSPAA